MIISRTYAKFMKKLSFGTNKFLILVDIVYTRVYN